MSLPKMSPAEGLTYTLLKYFIMAVVIVSGLTLPIFAKQQDSFMGKVVATVCLLALIGFASYVAVKVLFFFGGKKKSEKSLFNI